MKPASGRGIPTNRRRDMKRTWLFWRSAPAEERVAQTSVWQRAVRRGLMAAAAVGGLALAGCAGGYGYYASTPPPPVRYEVRGYAPSPGYVWIDGYWGYRGG